MDKVYVLNEKGEFICKECGFKAKNPGMFETHFSQAHGAELEESFDRLIQMEKEQTIVQDRYAIKSFAELTSRIDKPDYVTIPELNVAIPFKNLTLKEFVEWTSLTDNQEATAYFLKHTWGKVDNTVDEEVLKTKWDWDTQLLIANAIMRKKNFLERLKMFQDLSEQLPSS